MNRKLKVTLEDICNICEEFIKNDPTCQKLINEMYYDGYSDADLGNDDYAHDDWERISGDAEPEDCMSDDEYAKYMKDEFGVDVTGKDNERHEESILPF